MAGSPVANRVGLAVAGLLTVSLLAGCGGESSDASPVSGVSVHDGDGLAHGVVLPEPYAASSVPLRDTSGRAERLTAKTDEPLRLVFFGYTNCPDICQVVMASIASAMSRLDEQQRSQVSMTFVTTDPARDTTAVLRRYLDRFDPGFGGLTGPLPDIVKVGETLGVSIEKGQKLPSGGYDVAHGTQIVGLLPDGRAPYVWTEGTSPGDLAADISSILDGKVSTR